MTVDPKLEIGIACETFETYPRRNGEPADAHAEYEPESTLETLEAAIHTLGHRALRAGSPHELLAQLQLGSSAASAGKAELPVDAAGTSHFRVPSERGIELFRALRGRTSGFVIPRYVLDTPYGKVPLDHPHARGRDGEDFVVEAWDGRLWREPNPPD